MNAEKSELRLESKKFIQFLSVVICKNMNTVIVWVFLRLAASLKRDNYATS